MANHVYFNVDLSVSEHSNKTNELTTELARLGTIISSETSHGWTEYDSNLLPIYSVPFEEDNWYDWGIEHMGAKWVSIEDWDTSGVFSGHSAWSPIYPLVENLVRHLDEVLDTQVWAKFTYEDEFRNFIGKASIYSHRSIDGIEVITDVDELDSDEVYAWVYEPLGLEEIPDDFEWYEPQEKLEGYPADEWLDNKVYDWFSE
tara:strand:- start:9347 stop:9952 length:606 start_codon:yes stop_codon:yes gene_type:complete